MKTSIASYSLDNSSKYKPSKVSFLLGIVFNCSLLLIVNIIVSSFKPYTFTPIFPSNSNIYSTYPFVALEITGVEPLHKFWSAATKLIVADKFEIDVLLYGILGASLKLL